ncbi:MAG: UDP-N-acetylmuramate dehydrogenase [Verrucomicrobia bacterium]|nr:UDP-N-acetylmuramate dehydrogenase [Verrucomicrobiota bacterium]MBU1909600.1 UDP-N-acetylmuramate dehydrogenase [Verrucomicrobiota bacterium]
MNRAVLEQAGIEIADRAPLRDLTTFRLGGPCRACLTCRTPEQAALAVTELHRTGEPQVFIGGGSNLLVADAGLEAVVVRYTSAIAQIERAGGMLRVAASTALDALAAYGVQQELAGLEFLSGIPGTVGGAIAGNAGAFGRSVAECLEQVALMDHTGRTKDVPAADLECAYRRSRLQESGEIVLSAIFRLEPGARSELAAERERILALRRERHPDWKVTPTAGSFFRNVEPTSAAGARQAAGWFLERAGAKTMRVGGARIFEKHANIIVAEPGCTASDVAALSRQMADAVQRIFGITLQPEVRFLGEFIES